jgi:hypothetical protein
MKPELNSKQSPNLQQKVNQEVDMGEKQKSNTNMKLNLNKK